MHTFSAGTRFSYWCFCIKQTTLRLHFMGCFYVVHNFCLPFCIAPMPLLLVFLDRSVQSYLFFILSPLLISIAQLFRHSDISHIVRLFPLFIYLRLTCNIALDCCVLCSCCCSLWLCGNLSSRFISSNCVF